MKELVVGIDIGGTNTVIGLVTHTGDVLTENTISTRNHASFEDYIKRIAEEINWMLGKSDFDYTLKGIGIGAPNGSIRRGGISDATNLEWKGFLPVCDELQKFFDIPVRIINDAKAAALGELIYGAGQGLNHFIVITLGTGLGAGIVVNGEILLGTDEQAGELGHTTVKTDGRQCGCGKKGCLETYVSATGICRTALKLIANEGNRQSPLSQLPFRNISAKRIADTALEGDPVALEAFEYTGRILGIKLSDFVVTLNPEAIIITGGLANAGELILEPTRRHMEANLYNACKGKVRVIQSGLLGKNSGVLGAASLIWKSES